MIEPGRPQSGTDFIHGGDEDALGADILTNGIYSHTLRKAFVYSELTGTRRELAFDVTSTHTL